MVPELQRVDGAKRDVLPLGRYLASFEELEKLYVPKDDKNRRTIWEAFQDVLNQLRGVLNSVAAVWIGGSFITSETEPHDIDVVFIITEDAFNAATTDAARFALWVLSNNASTPPRLNPLVDGYLLVVPPTEYSLIDKRMTAYAQQRGYWDQFWSKTRFLDTNDERWRYPAAGYVEVMVDGYEIH